MATETLQGVDYEKSKDRFNRELGLETALSEGMALQVLHARLNCGLKLFVNHKVDEQLDIPPCIVKWVCKVMIQLEKKGELIEIPTTDERDFASAGNNRLNKDAKGASLCVTCVQRFCPVWKLVNA